ncbi:hypothetical protein K501DRAFT_267208 [Backusella circina FSU 941]|nr:hypothetical protein K501DRAFT_267208 [Backusella circina FSU 941]
MTSFENIYGEFILEVACHLDVYNKINLLSTCRKLRDLIATIYFYEDLSIPRARTKSMLTRFQKKELYSNQVKRLQIHLKQIEKLHLKLPQTFPRPQELIDKNYSVNDLLIEPQEANSNKFKNWKDKYVRYEVNKQYPHILLTLKKFKCLHLTFLEIRFSLGLPPKGHGLDITKCAQHELLSFHIGELVKVYNNGVILLRYIISKYPDLENLDIHMVLGDGLKDDGNDEMESLSFNDRDLDDEYENDKEDTHRVVQSIFSDDTEDDDYGDEFPLETYNPGTTKLYKESMLFFILDCMTSLKSIRVETIMIFLFTLNVDPENFNLTSLGFYRGFRKFDRSDNLEHLEFCQKIPKLEELFLEITRPQQLEIYQRRRTLTTHDNDLNNLLIPYPNFEELVIFTRNKSVLRGITDEDITYPQYLNSWLIYRVETENDKRSFMVRESRYSGSVKEISDDEAKKSSDLLIIEVKCKRLLSLKTASSPDIQIC